MNEKVKKKKASSAVERSRCSPRYVNAFPACIFSHPRGCESWQYWSPLNPFYRGLWAAGEHCPCTTKTGFVARADTHSESYYTTEFSESKWINTWHLVGITPSSCLHGGFEGFSSACTNVLWLDLTAGASPAQVTSETRQILKAQSAWSYFISYHFPKTRALHFSKRSFFFLKTGHIQSQVW